MIGDGRVLFVLAAGMITLALTACQSSQEKSAHLAKIGATLLLDQHGLRLSRTNRDVAVVSDAVVHDANGVAAVIELRNRTARDLARLPVSLNVLDAHGRSLYRNDAAGLATSLVQLSLLPAHGSQVWIDDQVPAGGVPASAQAQIGNPNAASQPHHPLPRITFSAVSLVNQQGGSAANQVGGESAQGMVLNHSTVTQTNLVIFCLARRGGRVIAAGRALIPSLPANKPTPFTIFFIGNPAGAKLELSAPPTAIG